MPEKPLKIMLSSTVYGNQNTIEAVYATLRGFGYDVLCSHKGTVYNIPGKSPEESCLAAVEDCDFFFGLIFPYYGSGITHKEFQRAVALDKPRGFLAHSTIPYTRTLLKDLMFDEHGVRTAFTLPRKTTVLDDLRVIDMYNDAIGHGQPLNKRIWAQEFYKYELDGAPFIQAQFADVQRFADDLKKLKDGK